MFDRLRRPILRVLRVPHEPVPPAGAPGSLQVCRAGHNYYKLRLVRWGLGQIGALVGIIVSLTFISRLERAAGDVRSEVRDDSPRAVTPVTPATADAPAATSHPEPQRRRAQAQARRNPPRHLARIAERSPRWIFPALKLLEAGGVLLYLLQIPITYALARLDYELRWYMVTDRSLRIRTGLTSVTESTMSFANVQQVVISQGPLQRMLGLSDLHVQSAGGGGDEQKSAHGDSLHRGVFHGVDNAQEIRDLILERLRQFRETGLGDPDDVQSTPSATTTPAPIQGASAGALAAAQELLDESRALRRAVG